MRTLLHSGRATAGYALLPRVLDVAEVTRLLARLHDLGHRTRAGARHLMSNSAVESIATDDRLVGIAQKWVGGTAIPFRATLFDKSPHSNWLIVWHQDTALPLEARADVPGWGPWSTKAGVVTSNRPRRVLHIEHAASLDVAPGLRLAVV